MAKTRSFRPIRTLMLLAGLLAVTAVVVTAIWGPAICLSRGRTLLDARQHETALQWLKRAQWLDDDNAEVHFLLAKAHRRLGHFDDVERHLRRADALGWNVAKLNREQLIALAQDGQFDAVAGQWGYLLKDAGADAPEIAEAFVTERLSKFMVQDAQLALEAWIADYQDDPQPRFLNGKMLEALGIWGEATQEYEAAVKLAPGRHDIRLRLAQGLMRQMRYQEAIEHLKLCVAADIENTDAAVALAQCWNKLGRTEECREILERELEKHPQHLTAIRELADLELANEQPEKAVELARRALEIEPVDRELHYVLARALQRTGKPEEAQREFALVNEATRPVLRLAKISPELAKDPSNIALRFEIAETTWKYRSRVEGARWLHSLLEFDPHHAPTHRLLAEHYDLLGDHDRAEFHRSVSNQNSPADDAKK